MKFEGKTYAVIICAFIFGIFVPEVKAQSGNCDVETPRKVIKKYEKLKKKISIDNSEARDEMKVLAEENPNFVDPVFFLANYYKKIAFKKKEARVQKKLIAKSISYYKRSIEICPSYSGHLAFYHLGILHHKKLHDLKSSAFYFQDYLDKEKEHPKRYKKRAKDLSDEYFTKYRLLENPVPYDPVKLKGVCTAEDEYLPMLSPDNNYLYLSRQRVTPLDLTQPLKNGNDKNEYFIQSRKMSVDSFSTGRFMGKPFNQFQETYGGQKLVGQGGICLTPDNKEMYLTLTLLSVPKKGSGSKNTQLYYTKKVDGQWKALRPMHAGINDEKGIATWEGQPTISSDGKMMVFATARLSSTAFMLGGEERNSMDLYVVHKYPNGNWGVPKSIGPVINTKGNEMTPFLHTDSKTLYFASNGHPGMGGYDVFYTQLDDNGQWSKPINIGYPINTEKDEHGLMVSLDGKFAYMSTGKKGAENGALDIIHFPLHPEARPDEVVFIKGTLADEDGKAVKNGKITIKNEQTGQEQEVLVDENTGEYVAVISVTDPKKAKLKSETIILDYKEEEVEVPFGSVVAKVNGDDEIIPPGAKVVKLNKKDVVLKKGEKIRKVNKELTIIPKDHEIIVEDDRQKVVPIAKQKEGKQKFVITATGDDMTFTTETLEADPDEIDGVKKIGGKVITVKKEEKGAVVRLNEVNFDVNSSLLNGKGMSVLDELITFLNSKKTIRISVHGHTDNVGDEGKNQVLSENRAKEVMLFLLENGIELSRVSSKGFGSSKPKVGNDTDPNRAVNRRVEFVIL